MNCGSPAAHVTTRETAGRLPDFLRALIVPLLATALVLSTRNAGAQEGASPPAPQWTPATLFPPGALLAVVSGDPAQPGQSTAELSLPDGYRVPRHFHPMGERLEVKQGTLLVGTGERFDVRKADTLRTGDSAFTATGVHHYWVALGPTVVALTFDGPYTITYVNAYEAPRGTSFPYRY
jgi:quercetin dioxygenase-like cupin family protein